MGPLGPLGFLGTPATSAEKCQVSNKDWPWQGMDFPEDKIIAERISRFIGPDFKVCFEIFYECWSTWKQLTWRMWMIFFYLITTFQPSHLFFWGRHILQAVSSLPLIWGYLVHHLDGQSLKVPFAVRAGSEKLEGAGWWAVKFWVLRHLPKGEAVSCHSPFPPPSPAALRNATCAQGHAESSRYLLDGDWKWEGAAAGYVQEYWILEYPKLWPWKNGEREVIKCYKSLVFAVSYSWQNRYDTKNNCCTLSASRQQTWILTFCLTLTHCIFWHLFDTYSDILFWCTMSATKDPSWFLNKNCSGFVAKRNYHDQCPKQFEWYWVM
jgi:hypothetical protein